jgi:fumarylacetoacetase
MANGINETHDPALLSWVDSANARESDFPLQNLPLAVFRRRGTDELWRGGVAIGDQVLDMASSLHAAAFASSVRDLIERAAKPTLNDLMATGPEGASALRFALSRALRRGASEEGPLRGCLLSQEECEFSLPAHIGDYTDFYTSIYHATAVGRMFRPNNPLPPNYRWLPIGYHGRASSVLVSGVGFARPTGQVLPPAADVPHLSASRRLDYELELGAFIGRGNVLGHPVDIDSAESHLFGLSILNDWSARDIQAWEYQPLGPFLGKSFATTISPWVIMLEALAPYRCAWQRPVGDVQPLPYLDAPELRRRGAIDIELEVRLETAEMRTQKLPPHLISRSGYRHAYWTLAQMVVHHTVNGCNLRAGDLLGTGTLSGPEPAEAGSLLELTENGSRPITLPNGERRSFLEDGDCVVMRACCARSGARRIGFGEAVGWVLPAMRTHDGLGGKR